MSVSSDKDAELFRVSEVRAPDHLLEELVEEKAPFVHCLQSRVAHEARNLIDSTTFMWHIWHVETWPSIDEQIPQHRKLAKPTHNFKFGTCIEINARHFVGEVVGAFEFRRVADVPLILDKA